MATELWELQIHGRAANDYNQVNLHFEGDNLTSGNSLINGDDLIAAWRSEIESLWLALLPGSYQVDRYIAHRTKPAKSPQCSRVLGDTIVVGTLGETFVSNAFCPVIRLVPTLGFQTGGKIFLPCLSEDAVTGNAFTAGFFSNLNDFMNGIMTPFSTTAITWASAIYSRQTDTYSLTTTFNAPTSFGYIRKRAKPF